MSRPKKHETTVYRSGEVNGMDYDYEIDVEYTVTPGYPERGPSYACGGTPADPPEIEILSSKVDGKHAELTDAEIEKILEDHDFTPDFDEDRGRYDDI